MLPIEQKNSLRGRFLRVTIPLIFLTVIGGAVNTASRLESQAAPGEILISYETYSQVKDQIHCKACGEIEVKGIPYPVATYQVIDNLDQPGKERQQFFRSQRNVNLRLDLAKMTSDDKRVAIRLLHEGLDLLTDN